MSRKLPIVIVLAALLALAAAPAGASAAELCPPGTHSRPYCTKTTGVTSNQHKAVATDEDKLVALTVHCDLKAGCLGTLLLEPRSKRQATKHNAKATGHSAGRGHHSGRAAAVRRIRARGSVGRLGGDQRARTSGRREGKASSTHKGKGKGHSRHKSGPTIYGKLLYTLEASSTTTLYIRLTAAGRHALLRKGELTVKVVARSKGFGETIDTLHMKAQKPGRKHHKGQVIY